MDKIERNAASRLVVEWLAIRVRNGASAGSEYCQQLLRRLAPLPASARMAIVGEVLERQPLLDAAVRQLTLQEQLELSVELVRGASSTRSRSTASAE